MVEVVYVYYIFFASGLFVNDRVGSSLRKNLVLQGCWIREREKRRERDALYTYPIFSFVRMTVGQSKLEEGKEPYSPSTALQTF